MLIIANYIKVLPLRKTLINPSKTIDFWWPKYNIVYFFPKPEKPKFEKCVLDYRQCSVSSSESSPIVSIPTFQVKPKL